MRRHDDGTGCGACGVGTNVPPLPRAAPGLRPGALRSPARSWLMGAVQALLGGSKVSVPIGADA
jgi:hypothetical protein